MKRLLLFCALVLPVALQAQNQLVPADDAVKLRKVWSMIGDDVEGKNRIGYAVTGLPDISGDSINEFVSD